MTDVSGVRELDALAASRGAEDLVLARLHLRLGMLTLARAELEDLATREALDLGGLAALAEVRWRSGDLDSAMDAAASHLEAGGSDPIALIIAVESSAAEGRPAEARRLMDRLGPVDPAGLDVLFGGMPRRAFWPAVPGATEAPTLFPEGTSGGPSSTRPTIDGASVPVRRDIAPPAARSAGSPLAGSPLPGPPPRLVPGPSDVLAATPPGLWDADVAGAGSSSDARSHRPGADTPRRRIHTDPRAELDLARDELDDDPDQAFLRLGLALRLDPTLAADVLEVVEHRGEPAASLLRGDVERLLGRHLEAEAAFAEAADALDRAAERRVGHHSPGGVEPSAPEPTPNLEDS
jgi:hypothetical protein